MKPLEPGLDRRRAGLALVQHLFDNAVAIHETHHLKARFTPIGTDGDRVVVLVEEPGKSDTTIQIEPLRPPTPEIEALVRRHARFGEAETA